MMSRRSTRVLLHDERLDGFAERVSSPRSRRSSTPGWPANSLLDLVGHRLGNEPDTRICPSCVSGRFWCRRPVSSRRLSPVRSRRPEVPNLGGFVGPVPGTGHYLRPWRRFHRPCERHLVAVVVADRDIGRGHGYADSEPLKSGGRRIAGQGR